MSFQDSLLEVGRYLSRKMPASLFRPIAMPFTYQTRVADGFVFENANMINTAFGYCANNKIQGDFAEFGVFKGTTSVEAWKASKRHGLNSMKFYFFDSFEGLPEVGGIDQGGPFETAEFSSTRGYYENYLRRYGIDFNRIKIVEGFFDKTLPNSDIDSKICVAWIDCDLYESTVPVLDWLTPRLVDGAILCFDDWFCFNGNPNKGEQKATAEWLANNDFFELFPYRDFHWAGKSYIFHKK
jgi:O-methyltransferase